MKYGLDANVAAKWVLMQENAPMKAIAATYTHGQIVPSEPVDWPQGMPLLVEPLSPDAGRVGINESQWRDDPEALADWDRWIASIEPLEWSDQERAAHTEYMRQFAQYNLDQVRRQMDLQE